MVLAVTRADIAPERSGLVAIQEKIPEIRVDRIQGERERDGAHLTRLEKQLTELRTVADQLRQRLQVIERGTE
jgi:hypothetical protein